jgi:hypothetical protein
MLSKIILYVFLVPVSAVITTKMTDLLADSIYYAATDEIYLFGSMWLGLLFITASVIYLGIVEVLDFIDNRPRRPLRNR